MSVYYVAGIPYSDELFHHGIKGQKWGIRRFQNLDGTLTAEGKERYSSDHGASEYLKRYRDAYGNETEAGKNFINSYERIHSLPSGANDDEIYSFFHNEELRVKKLFEDSSDPFLRKEETQQKILSIWNSALFKEYNGYDFDEAAEGKKNGISQKEISKLQSLENKARLADNKSIAKRDKMLGNLFDTDFKAWKKAYDEWENSEEYALSQKAYKEYDAYSRRLSGKAKMKTMKEIMSMVTPEMRDDVYAFLTLNYYYD